MHNSGKSYLKPFDEKADEGIFMGYLSTSKAFKILNKMTMAVEESIRVVFDEPNFNKYFSEDLAKKVDKLKLDEEVYQEAEDPEQIDDATKIGIRKAKLPKSLLDDPEDDKANYLEVTSIQPEMSDDESILQRTLVPIRLEPDLRWLRDHPLESIIGDVREGVRKRRST